MKFAPTMPKAFTENGVAMLSSVLRSRRSVMVNIQIMRTFTRLRRLLVGHDTLAKKIRDLERRARVCGADIENIFQVLQQLIAGDKDKLTVVGFQDK